MWDLFQGYKNGSTCENQWMKYTKLTKWGENHMIISTDTEKAWDKSQHPFMMKALSKAGVKGKYNIINVIYDKPTANIILKGENLKVIPLRLGTSKGFQLSSVLFKILLEVLARVIREKNKFEKIKIRKEKKIFVCRWYDLICWKF